MRIFFEKIKIMQTSDAHTELCCNSGFGDSTTVGQHSACPETKQLEDPTFQHKNTQSTVGPTSSSNFRTAWHSWRKKKIPCGLPLYFLRLLGLMLLAHKEVVWLLVGDKTQVLQLLTLALDMKTNYLKAVLGHAGVEKWLKAFLQFEQAKNSPISEG